MKRAILFLALTAFLLSFTSDRAAMPGPAVQDIDSPKPAAPQVLTVKGTAQDFQFLLQLLDNPEPKLRDVRLVQDWIVRQLQLQIDSTGAPKKDSAKGK